MEIKSERYMGCLAFNDHVFCRQLYIFLQDHIGKSIKEIGVSHTNSELHHGIVEADSTHSWFSAFKVTTFGFSD